MPTSGGSWWLITHLSYPENNSVNHFIDPNDCTVAYTSLYRVLQEDARLGRGTVLAKNGYQVSIQIDYHKSRGF